MMNIILSTSFFELTILISVLALVVILILVVLFFMSRQYIVSSEKISPYECGFEPFSTAREKHNIQFIVIAILFILFYLELVFLIPWILFSCELSFFSFFVIIGFLVLLVLGFMVEILAGLLDNTSATVSGKGWGG